MRFIVRTFTSGTFSLHGRSRVLNEIISATTFASNKTPDKDIRNLSIGWIGRKLKDTAVKAEPKVESQVYQSAICQDIFTGLSQSCRPNLIATDSRFKTLLSKARHDQLKGYTMVLENTRLIADALKSGGKLLTLYFSDRSSLKGLPFTCPDAEYYHVPYKVLRRWSSTVTSQGVFAIFEWPSMESILKRQTKHLTLPVTVVCDQMEDPGNLGTILRTAAAFNVHRVMIMHGDLQAENAHVVRAASGAHFCVPIQSSVTWAEIDNLLGNPCRVVAMSCALDQTDELHCMPYTTVEYWRTPASSPISQTLFLKEANRSWSSEAWNLFKERRATMLTLPYHQVPSAAHHSLTSPVTAAVLLGEMQRQFLLYQSLT